MVRPPLAVNLAQLQDTGLRKKSGISQRSKVSLPKASKCLDMSNLLPPAPGQIHV